MNIKQDNIDSSFMQLYGSSCEALNNESLCTFPYPRSVQYVSDDLY